MYNLGCLYSEDEEENVESTVKVQIQRAELVSSGRRRSTLTDVGLSRDLLRDLAKFDFILFLDWICCVFFRAPADKRLRNIYYSPMIIKAMENIDLIGSILRKEEADSEVFFIEINVIFVYVEIDKRLNWMIELK